MKLNTQIQLEKELRVVSNIQILKEQKDDLKTAGIWDAFGILEPEDIESWLVKTNLSAESHDELLREIADLTEGAISGINDSYDEDIRDILNEIEAMKSESCHFSEEEKTEADFE